MVLLSHVTSGQVKPGQVKSRKVSVKSEIVSFNDMCFVYAVYIERGI